MKNRLTYLIIACSALHIALQVVATAQQEFRLWRSADGLRSIEARFVERTADSVTVLRRDDREVTIPLAEVHRSDVAWLNSTHPIAKHSSDPNAERPEKHPVLDTLLFGDKRDVVKMKLLASEQFQSGLPETMLGRTGLNGVFRSREDAAFPVTLDFAWDESGGMSEITLRSAPLSDEPIPARLQPCLDHWIRELKKRHGALLQANPTSDLRSLAADSMSASHVWRLPGGGSVLLGAARDAESYQIAIRYTAEKIEPTFVPSAEN
ncbi:MAG: hypothetical protein ACO3RV_00740 [Luteolibacter sp.]